MDRADYFARWASLHGGYDPAGSRVVSGWLTVVHALARPLARRHVPPDLVTLLGLVIALAAPGAAFAGGGWLWVAVAVILLSGLLDNLDGAVAVMSERTTAWGHVLDSVVDRCCDALYLVALWAVGAPAAVCVAGGFAMGLAEYVRARAAGAGMTEVGVVTVFERPTRVLVAAAFVLGAAVFPDSADRWAAAGAWLWLLLAMIGLAQILVAVRRRLL